MSEEKTKKKTKAKKIRSIIEWVVSGVFLAAAAALVVFRIVQKQSGKAIPLFGSYYCVVQTDSMVPDYKVKDVLVVKKVDPKDIKVGDDITFYWSELPNFPITHRVEEIRYNDTGTGDYTYKFVVHGINTQSNQCGVDSPCDITWKIQTPTEKDLVGKVMRKSPVMKAVTSVWGLIILILVPSSYLMITTVLDMFKKLDEQEEEGKSEDAVSGSLQSLSKKEIEELKKQMLEEMLSKGKK